MKDDYTADKQKAHYQHSSGTKLQTSTITRVEFEDGRVVSFSRGGSSTAFRKCGVRRHGIKLRIQVLVEGDNKLNVNNTHTSRLQYRLPHLT